MLGFLQILRAFCQILMRSPLSRSTDQFLAVGHNCGPDRCCRCLAGFLCTHGSESDRADDAGRYTFRN